MRTFAKNKKGGSIAAAALKSSSVGFSLRPRNNAARSQMLASHVTAFFVLVFSPAQFKRTMPTFPRFR
jgi:hypothetical protein